MRALWVLTLLTSAVAAGQTVADEAATILRQNCGACHGAAMKMSGLDLRTREAMLKGGEHGPALVPGDAAKSKLFRQVSGAENPTMPPGKRLSDAQIATLRKWIEAGAPVTVAAAPAAAEAKAALAKMEERPITDEERGYWAFRPPVRTVVPKNGFGNPVDAFLRDSLTKKGLKASGAADRRTQIRRAYLAMTGLPPAPERVESFVRDGDWNRVVEELLASPHYGENWARHWLDLVRYADSGGFEFDRDRPNAWRYRDYVVRAFNEDKPYDRFLQEQLAGDELWPDSAEARIATGYLRLGAENNLKNEQTRLDELDDIVSTTANALLGVTVGCARCHNHKFDPVPQKDYYRMQAVFFPLKTYEHPLVGAAEIASHEAEQKRIAGLQGPLKRDLAALEKPHRDRILEAKKTRLPDYIQVALKTPPEQRTEGQKLNARQVERTLDVSAAELEEALGQADKERWRSLKGEIEALEKQRPRPYPTAMSVAEPGREAPPSYFLFRGSPGSRGSVMQPGVLTVASRNEWQFATPPADSQTSWRRRGFAEWAASKDNPLTARVMVNRLWQHHFGEGLVRTPSNFGKTGERPTHPELLDWLATEFVAQGWSMKAIHRLVLTSETYRMASDDRAANVKADGDNRLLWRMPRRRMNAESIRDSILAVAGNLDRSVGGPAMYPYIDPALFQSSSKRTWSGQPDSDPSTWRRSLYVFNKRSIPLPMLEVFDKPETVISCARRNRSTIAPQALILMNNAFVVMEAEKFAARLKAEAGEDPGAQVDRAFAIGLNRAPSATERARSIEFLRTGPLADFAQTIFSLNEFAFIP